MKKNNTSTFANILSGIIKFIIIATILVLILWKGMLLVYPYAWVQIIKGNDGKKYGFNGNTSQWSLLADNNAEVQSLGTNTPPGYEDGDYEILEEQDYSNADVTENTETTNEEEAQEKHETRVKKTQETVKETVDTMTHPTKLLSKAVQLMASQMIEGLGAILSTGAVDAGDSLVQGMVSQFGPDLSTFENVLGGGDLKGGGSGKAAAGGKQAKKFINIAKATGFTIATIVLVMSLVLYFVAEPGSIKDTPLRLLIRYAIALFLIFHSFEVMQEFLEVGNNLWKNYVVTTAVDGSNKELNFEQMLPITNEGGTNIADSTLSKMIARNKGGTYTEPTAESIDQIDAGDICLFGLKLPTFKFILPLLFMFPIIAIICAWPLLKNFFKFYVEIIERYLVVCLLTLLFGAAASTIVSKNSSQVMRSYMQMLASQIFLLFMNVVFMAVFIDVLQQGGWTRSIPNYIFALAYLRVCQQIDSYMARLNLSVAQTGGQTMDCLAGTVRNFAGAIGSAGRAARGASGVIGDAMLNKGNTTGGALMKSVAQGGLIGGAAKVANAGGMAKAGLDEAWKAGKRVPVSAEKAKEVMGDFLKSPSNVTKGRFGAMDNKSQLSAVNSMLAAGGQDFKATALDTSKIHQGQIGFTGQTRDGRAVSGTISSTSMQGATTINGGSMGSAYLSAQTANYAKGTSFTPKDVSHGANAKGGPGTPSPKAATQKMSTPNQPGKTPYGPTPVPGTPGAQTYNHSALQSLGMQTGTSAVLSDAVSSGSLNEGALARMEADGSGGYMLYDKDDNALGSITDIGGQQTFSSATYDMSSLNDSDTMRGIEKQAGFVEGSLSWDMNNKGSDADAGRILGSAEVIDSYGKKQQVEVAGHNLGINPEMVNEKGARVVNAGQSGQNLAVQYRPLKTVPTAGSRQQTPPSPTPSSAPQQPKPSSSQSMSGKTMPTQQSSSLKPPKGLGNPTPGSTSTSTSKGSKTPKPTKTGSNKKGKK